MHRRKEWRDVSLRAKGVCVVAIPAAATVGIACLSFALAGRSTTAEDWVNHTRQACEDGFKLRLGEIFPSFDSAREKLVALTADRPAQQKRLAQIARMASSRPRSAFLHNRPLPFQRFTGERAARGRCSRRVAHCRVIGVFAAVLGRGIRGSLVIHRDAAKYWGWRIGRPRTIRRFPSLRRALPDESIQHSNPWGPSQLARPWDQPSTQRALRRLLGYSLPIALR